jgi:hypothetical protein
MSNIFLGNVQSLDLCILGLFVFLKLSRFKLKVLTFVQVQYCSNQPKFNTQSEYGSKLYGGTTRPITEHDCLPERDTFYSGDAGSYRRKIEQIRLERDNISSI